MTCPTCDGDGTVRPDDAPPPPPDRVCGGACDAPFGCGPTDEHTRWCPTCCGVGEASDEALEERQRRVTVLDHVQLDRRAFGAWCCRCPWCVEAIRQLVTWAIEREERAS